MKNSKMTVLLRLLLMMILLCMIEYLYGKLVMHQLVTKQDALIWLGYILGGILIAAVGVMANHFLNGPLKITANMLLVVNVVGAILSGLFYLGIAGFMDKGLGYAYDYTKETHYFLIFVLTWFVIGSVLVEAVLYRLIVKVK